MGGRICLGSLCCFRRGIHIGFLFAFDFRQSGLLCSQRRRSLRHGLGSSRSVGQSVFRQCQFRFPRRRKFYEIGIAAICNEIAKPLGCHLFFQELDLCFVSRFRRFIAAEIRQLLSEISQARREVCAYSSGATIGVGNIAVALDCGGPSAIGIRAADGDGLLAMDTGISAAIHHYVSRRVHHLLAEGAAFSAESVGQGIHPVLHFAGAHGDDGACIGFEMDVPIALDVRALLHVQSRGAIGGSHGILLDGNRDGGGIQDIAMSSDTDGAIISLAIPAGHSRDVALGGFSCGCEIRIRVAIVGHIIFRACITGRAIDIHDGIAFNGGVIAAAHSDGAAFIGAIISGSARAGIRHFVALAIGRFRITGKKRCGPYGGGGIGGDILCILDVRRADHRTGSQAASVGRNNFTVCVNRDGILIIESLALRNLILIKRGSVGFDGGRADVYLRFVGDGGAIHHAIAAGQRRADALDGLITGLVFSGGFVFRGDFRFLIGGNRCRTDGGGDGGGDIRLRLAAGTTVAAGANGVDLPIHGIFMGRAKLCGLRGDVGASDIHLRFLVHIHF